MAADHCYEGLVRRIEDPRRYELDTLRKCLDSDSINRRYENDNNTMRRYDNSTDTIRSIQNDIKKIDNSLNNTLARSDRHHERNANENMENHRRFEGNAGQNLLTTDGISLSGTLTRKFSNYDNTRKLDEGNLARRIRDDPDISSSSISSRSNH